MPGVQKAADTSADLLELQVRIERTQIEPNNLNWLHNSKGIHRTVSHLPVAQDHV